MVQIYPVQRLKASPQSLSVPVIPAATLGVQTIEFGPSHLQVLTMTDTTMDVLIWSPHPPSPPPPTSTWWTSSATTRPWTRWSRSTPCPITRGPPPSSPPLSSPNTPPSPCL